MKTRKASIKETGEELSQADWARFDAAVAKIKADQRKVRGIGNGGTEAGWVDRTRGPNRPIVYRG